MPLSSIDSSMFKVTPSACFIMSRSEIGPLGEIRTNFVILMYKASEEKWNNCFELGNWPPVS